MSGCGSQFCAWYGIASQKNQRFLLGCDSKNVVGELTEFDAILPLRVLLNFSKFQLSFVILTTFQLKNAIQQRRSKYTLKKNPSVNRIIFAQFKPNDLFEVDGT